MNDAVCLPGRYMYLVNNYYLYYLYFFLSVYQQQEVSLKVEHGIPSLLSVTDISFFMEASAMARKL